MSYVESNLMKGEDILATGKVHWWIYSTGFFWLILGILIQISSGFESTGGISEFILLIGVIFLIKAAIYTFTTELALTNKRIIAKFGFISRRTIEITHKNIESLGVNQGIAGCTY